MATMILRIGYVAIVLLVLSLQHEAASLANVTTADGKILDEAVVRATAVKTFGETIGIEPSDSLRVSTRAQPEGEFRNLAIRNSPSGRLLSQTFGSLML